MRDNGIPAQSWAHLADVDPWVAQAALDALRDAGVAAYSVPHPGRAGPYLDVQLPDRPTDRLFVEVGTRERAFEVLNSLTVTPDDRPQGPLVDPDVDAAFADIVSRLDISPSNGRSPDRHEERLDPGDWKDVERDTSARADSHLGDPTEGRISAHIGWDDLLADEPPAQPADPEDPEDRYVPPPPPPVPRGTPLRRFAWAAVLGAPLIVALCTLFGYRLEGWTGFIVVVAFLAGLGTLFATLGERPDDEDDPDHGAVV
jgi:hypothetical protein